MRTLLITISLFGILGCAAQDRFPVVHDPSAEMPPWAQLMYTTDPDVRAVEEAYKAFYRDHKFEKTVPTQHYKLWLNSVRGNVDVSGHVRQRTAEQLLAREHQLKELRQVEASSRGEGGGWTWAGPEAHVADDGGGEEVAEQSNVYTIDRSLSNPRHPLLWHRERWRL